jgi:hypothetical protein
MTTVIASFNVADYDHWRAGSAHAVGDSNLRSCRIWQGQDNPNRVVIIETFDTREYAEQVFTSETTHKAMTADGVYLASLSVEYLDEAN